MTEEASLQLSRVQSENVFDIFHFATVTVMNFQERQLYGGAMTIALPSSFVDVSEMRPVPDHQEVFCDTASNCNQSVVLEIVEMGPSDVVDVAAYYLRDWMEQNEATSESHAHTPSSQAIDSSRLTESTASHSTVHITSSRMLVGQAIVLIHLAVLRLPRAASDLLITLSIPEPDDHQDPDNNSFLLGSICSLQIKDWTLFGSE